MTSFDGVGVWVDDYAGTGTVLSAADAASYKSEGIDWICVKVSDGVTGDPNPPGQAIETYGLVQQAGMRAIPWAFMYGTLAVLAQLETMMEAAGGGYGGGHGLDGEAGISDIEAAFPGSIAGFNGLGELAICTWGNPVATELLDVGHPGAPSIGNFVLQGASAFLPQAYAGAWKVSETEAVAIAMAAYDACKPGLPIFPPVLPVGDTANMLAFAQAAKAAGCAGVSAWRHGSPITPAAMAGVKALFPNSTPPPPAPPTPTPPAPTPVQLTAGTEYQTPKGDVLVLS